MMTKLCTLLLAFSTACSVLGSPVIDAAQLGDAHLRRQETSSATSAMSTTTSSSSSAATTTTAAPTASPSDLSQASIEVISGLRAASDGVRQVKNESLASNNTAVAALADIAQSEIALAGAGVGAVYANILNGSDPNAGGQNPQGQLGAALISLNGTALALPVAVANSTTNLTDAINVVQQGVALAFAGASALAVAEGLTGIVGVNSTFSSALPSATIGACSSLNSSAIPTSTASGAESSTSASASAESSTSTSSATESSASATSSA